MPISFFENAYLLKSIGWAIVNSIWQTGVLWIFYLAFTKADKNLPALAKYYLSLALLFCSFGWFVFTIANNYNAKEHTGFSDVKNSFLFYRFINNSLSFCAAAYLIMLVFYAAKFLNYFSRLRFTGAKNLTSVPAAIRLFTTCTATSLGIHKKIQVWFSAHVEVPSVTGIFKPIILLPVAIVNNLSAIQVNAILLHELAHIKRNDFLINLLQSSIMLALFFNPFALLLNKVTKQERENCCDNQVISCGYDKLIYAKALLLLEEHRHHYITIAMAATSNKKLLSIRIKRMFESRNTHTGICMFQKIQLLAVCMLFLAGIYLLTPLPGTEIYNGKIAGSSIAKKAEAFKLNKNYPKQKLYFTVDYPPVSKNFRGLIHTSTQVKHIPVTKKQMALNNSTNYILALVNEDELPGNKLKNEIEKANASLILNKQKDSLRSILVKIEDEQSGRKQTDTYYFKINNSNGKTEIKPLLILKKYKLLVKQPNTPSSLHAKKFTIKKRVTT